MRGRAVADIVPEHCAKAVVVLGCGNVLCGDDGFGPAVAEKLLAAGGLPPWAAVINAGTGVREMLFDMVLSEPRPVAVVLADAMDAGRQSGEVFEVPLDEIPAAKVSEFSPHQAPTLNLLRDLQGSCGVSVTVVACQVGSIPREVLMELSPPVSAAVDRAAGLIAERFLRGPTAGSQKG